MLWAELRQQAGVALAVAARVLIELQGQLLHKIGPVQAAGVAELQPAFAGLLGQLLRHGGRREEVDVLPVHAGPAIGEAAIDERSFAAHAALGAPAVAKRPRIRGVGGRQHVVEHVVERAVRVAHKLPVAIGSGRQQRGAAGVVAGLQLEASFELALAVGTGQGVVHLPEVNLGLHRLVLPEAAQPGAAQRLGHRHGGINEHGPAAGGQLAARVRRPGVAVVGRGLQHLHLHVGGLQALLHQGGRRARRLLGQGSD